VSGEGILLTKRMDGSLVPINDDEAERLRRFKGGDLVECKLIRIRNGKFLAKFMCLIKVGYDVWSEHVQPLEYKGMAVLPNLEQFRGDITVLAGYYEACVNIMGDTRLKPKSVSFANMDEEEFESLYSAVIDVLLRGVLGQLGYDQKTLREHVDRILSFS
jgi:hypothetical protein